MEPSMDVRLPPMGVMDLARQRDLLGGLTPEQMWDRVMERIHALPLDSLFLSGWEDGADEWAVPAPLDQQVVAEVLGCDPSALAPTVSVGCLCGLSDRECPQADSYGTCPRCGELITE